MQLDYIAMAAATLVSMLLGALWYSPLLFGNRWMACLGKTKETLGSATIPMLGSLFASLLTAVGVGLIYSLLSVDSMSMAVGVGLILGLLIIFPALLTDNLFCGWGWTLLWIQSGYRVTAVLLMSVVFYIM